MEPREGDAFGSALLDTLAAVAGWQVTDHHPGIGYAVCLTRVRPETT